MPGPNFYKRRHLFQNDADTISSSHHRERNKKKNIEICNIIFKNVFFWFHIVRHYRYQTISPSDSRYT